MPTIETLTVDIVANTSKFSKGLKVAAAGLGALAAGAGFAFKQFEDSERIAAQTDAVLKSTGGAANVTAGDIDRLSTKLMELSAVDDEVIREGQNMLLTFKNIQNQAGKGNAIFDRASKSLLDLSVAMGKEPASAAIQLGKALNDPIAGLSALGRAGIQFSESQEKAITKFAESGDVLSAQKIILKELDSQFGGSAKAQATASAKMSVAFGELAERIGKAVAPAAMFLLDALSSLADFMESHVGPAFAVIRDWLDKVWKAVRPVAETFGTMLLDSLRQVWAILSKDFIPAVIRAWNAMQPVREIIFAIAGVALVLLIKALPIVARLLAFVAEALARVWERIQKVIAIIKVAIGWIRDRFVTAWKVLKAVAVGIWEGIKKTAINAIDAIIRFFTSAINFIIRRINDVIYAINLIKPGADIRELAELGSGTAATGIGNAVANVGNTVGNAVNVNLRVDRRRFTDAITRDTAFRGW